jgi:hypothetical protein
MTVGQVHGHIGEEVQAHSAIGQADGPLANGFGVQDHRTLPQGAGGRRDGRWEPAAAAAATR